LRKMKKMIFVVLRKNNLKVQCLLMKDKNPDAFQLLTELPEESTITVSGEITKALQQIESCDVHQFEIAIQDIVVLSVAKPLPFLIANANEILTSDENKEQPDDIENIRLKVPRATRLENRWLDLRATNNYIIVQLRSALINAIRRIALDEEGFIEVSTPKIIPAISESGSSAFQLKYFGRDAYLAQSPQLYKQMLINGGLQGVFEVGPVFRAEHSLTYRHLCEFTGIDLELSIEPTEDHYSLAKTIWSILFRSFEAFYTQNQPLVEHILGETSAGKPVIPEEPIIIDFCQGAELLDAAGFPQSKSEDIGAINEKELGRIVKEKYNTDLFVLINYPSAARPFYTMVDSTVDEQGNRIYAKYSKSYDFILRGGEILSGAQRNHDVEILKDRIKQSGITLDFETKSTGLEDYVRSFEYGTLPHGGCGMGVERLVMLYLGLSNVKSVATFPRDPKTIYP